MFALLRLVLMADDDVALPCVARALTREDLLKSQSLRDGGQDRGVGGGASAGNGSRSSAKRPTSSAATCCASAATARCRKTDAPTGLQRARDQRRDFGQARDRSSSSFRARANCLGDAAQRVFEARAKVALFAAGEQEFEPPPRPRLPPCESTRVAVRAQRASHRPERATCDERKCQRVAIGVTHEANARQRHRPRSRTAPRGRDLVLGAAQYELAAGLGGDRHHQRAPLRR